MKKKAEIQPAMMSGAETQALLDSLVKKMKRNSRYALASFLCIVVCFIMSVQFPKPLSTFFGYVVVVQFFIVLPALLLIRRSKIRKKINKVVGENLTRSVLQEVFEVETYSAHDCLKKDFIEEMKLVSGWKTIGGGPYVSGKYKGRSVIFNEIEFGYFDSDHGYRTVFCGPWIIIEHAQTLSSPVWVVPDTGKRKKRKYEPENAESGLKFSLFRLNRAASDVTPTPDFFELLEPFYTVLPGKKYMTFYENKLCVAINYDRRTYVYSNRDLKDINELRKEFLAKTKSITDALDELIKIDRFFNEL